MVTDLILSFISIPSLSRLMKFQNLSKLAAKLLTVNNSVYKTMILLKFCSLKSLRQLLVDRSLDHTLTGKTDQCFRL